MPALIRSYQQLVDTPLKRYAGNPIIKHTGKPDDWKGGQVQESFVFPDPKDASKLIMFYSGAVPAGVAAIGRATATVAEPFKWVDHPDNPIVKPGATPFNKGYIRLDAMLYLDGVYWLYSTGYTDGPPNASGRPTYGVNTILLAKSTDGVKFDWREQPVLLPEGDERDVSQAAVLKEGDQWYMYYSYRTKAGQVLPGIRLATSDNGVSWKPGGQILTVKKGHYDSKYYEWHQIVKLGEDYVLLSEVFDGMHWSIGVAHSKSPTNEWKVSANPLFSHSGVAGAFDEHHVATGGLFDVGGQTMLFYQGGNNIQDYIKSQWDIGVAVFG